MHSLLKRFEARVALEPPQAAKLLGCAKSSYYRLRSGSELPTVVRRLVEVMLKISDHELQKLIRDFVDDDDL